MRTRGPAGLSIIGAALYPAKLQTHFIDSSFVSVRALTFENARDITIVANRFQNMAGPAIAFSGITRSEFWTMS